MARDKGRSPSAPPAALREYRKKRDFSRTPEPEGGSAGGRRGDRTFVIQKHAATRLHYDFRLELEGTLKSWAVPKGPSLDPLERRLAMHVEDHPIEYGGFEGIIPKGEYGGGTVLLWDRGTWEPEEDPHKGYHAGSLKFTLHGEKLKGSWALVRINDKRQTRDAGKSWLLIKHRDAEARPAQELSIVEARPESVATGRSMEEIAAAGDRVWHSNGGEAKTTPEPAARATGRRAAAAKKPRAPALSAEDVPGARRGRLPKFVPPQLATLAAKAPPGEEWLHELKFDGYRILARLEDGRARLMSRNERDWTAKFPAVAEGVARLRVSTAMLDGEVAVFLPDGKTSFQALQNAASGEDTGGRLTYVVFDLLHLDGWDMTGARLEDRKALLARLLKASPAPDPLKYSDHVDGAGPEFFAQACRLGLEGVVSKRRDALYQSARTSDWLKIKCTREQEVVIGGYTDPEGSRVGIGALLAGVYDGGRLVFAGKVGTGFSDKTLRELHKRLRALEQDACPFTPCPTGLGRPHWVKPSLVAQVTFGEWTTDGRMRHPSFQGLREDKPAEEVVREMPTPDKSSPPSPPAKRPAAGRGGGRNDEVAEVAGVRLTHANRVLYPSQGKTKRDLALFYESIADWILPHLAGRPTSLVRCPEGVDKECFYQKHVGFGVPEAIRRVKIREKTKVGDYLVVDTLPALISLVQIGILEIHTWNSVVDRLEQPDRVVFDLDPAPDVPWPRVVAAARLVRKRLEALGLESFVKTTGGKGLHVVVPLASGVTWEQGADFSRAVAESLAREGPRAFIAQMSKAARTGKVFIDHFRNARGATSVAAYSTRAKPEAPVSVPLEWDELSARLTSDHYTVANLPRRLAGLRKDPWARYWTVRQELPAESTAGRG
jgi:bifunctional non-homologous end joining protein LigD